MKLLDFYDFKTFFGILGYSCNVLGHLWASWRRLGHVLGPFWVVFLSSWAVLGDLGGVWRRLGSSWAVFGVVLEVSWRVLETSWGRLELSWRPLGVSWGHLGGVLETLGGQDPTRARATRFLEASWDRLGHIFGRFLCDFLNEISILFLPYPETRQHVVKPKK